MGAQHTPGPWMAFNMVHAERGDTMTPEEIGEYVTNSVRKSVEYGGSLDRFLFISAGGDGPDICHVGNGPAGPYNARLIAAAPDLAHELREARTTISILRTQIMVEIGRCADPRDSRWEGVPEKLKERLDAIDAAIAKALGQDAEGVS